MNIFFPIIVNVAVAITPATPAEFPGYTYTQTEGDLCWVTPTNSETEIYVSDDEGWCEYSVQTGIIFTVTVENALGEMVTKTFTADAEAQEYNVLP